jgi:hypothetical protein
VINAATEMSTVLRLPRSIVGWIVFLLTSPLALAAPKKSPSEIKNEEMLRVAEYLLDQCNQFGWLRIGTWALVSTLISFFIFWPASKLLAGKNGKFTKNVSYFGQLTLLGALFLAVAVVAIRSGWIIVLACLGLGILIATVSAAKQVFEISMWRAIGLAICLMIISTGSNFAAELAAGKMPWTEFEQKSADERKLIIAKWQAEKKERERQASNPSAPAPAPTLQDMYANLQKSRETLDLNDPAAVARFNEQVAAYNVAKAAAAPATPAPNPATPKATGSVKQGTPSKK